MKQLLPCLVLLTAAFASCKKSNNPDIPIVVPPAVIPIDSVQGNITGTISPAGAAVSIKATNAQNYLSYPAVPNAAGTFKLANVDPGSYKVSFTSAAGFVAPADVTTTVVGKQDVNIGNFVFQSAAGISGTISPTGSATYVEVMNTQTAKPYPVTLNAATGNFQSAALPSGPYRVGFSAASGYRPAGDVTLTLVEGQSTNIGTIVMLLNRFSGAPFTGQTSSLSYAAPNLTLSTAYVDIDMGSRKDFKIVMDNITGPGTYVCKNTATSNISYSNKTYINIPTVTWSTMSTGGGGTVVVTSIDPVKKEMKGTFTATLTNPLNANIEINNGSFDFNY